ncbi:hypothetical protein NL676_009715 [Syzygium grande]|nr:hypothetical protein NL676_009715 [Syzygium grande]
MDPFSYISAVRDVVELIALAWRKVQEELKLAKDAERELRKLMEFNGIMGRLLNEAYSKEVTDEQLKPYIKRIWEFFFDSEDAIEDLRRRESKCKGKDPASSLRRHYNKRTFTVESRDIKQMWQDFTADLGITTPTETFNGLTVSHAQPSSSAGHGSSSDAIFDKTDDLVGIEGPMNELVQCLTGESPMPKMIFVHGVQGVGKTSLVAAVLRNENVKSHFEYCVNRQGRKIQLEEAFGHMKKNVGSTANKISWVLVLDDVGRADVFRSLRSHLIENPPSVLVTTRVRSLKSSSPDYLEAQYDLHNFEHVVLSENDSHSLLYRKMKDLQLECDRSPNLKDASDCILRRCRGLPIAILATCRLLQSNNQFNVAATPNAVQWTDWSGRLEEKLLSRGHVVDASGRKITLRLNHLINVRDCLFYLSIFPLDRPIRCSTLTRLWMAEGFIEQEGSQPVQEKAMETLEKLLEHNVIREKRTSYGRVKTGRVHNLLHQIIISKLKDEAFTMIVADPKERLPENVRYLSFHSPMGEIDNGTSFEHLRSLHFFKEVHPPSLKNLLEKVERLKVLDFQRYLTEEEKEYPPPSLNTFPRKILRSKYLTYLSLRGTDIKIIPNEIEDLAYLESLDLKGTLVDELPKGILKLKVLCHLLVSKSNRSWRVDTDPTLAIGSNRSRPVDTDPTLAIGSNRSLEVGVKAPSKLGDLTLLQKLCMIELKAVEGGSQHEREQLLEELEKLTNLQRLGLSMLKSTDTERLCSSIEKLTNLVALRLIAAPEAKIDLSKKDMRQALKRLQRVHLTGCLGTLPEWILRSDILVKLVLKRSQLTIDALQQLGELLSLEHLELEQVFDVTDMKFEVEKFQKLRFLGLDGFDKLESIRVDPGALPALERLFLAQCNSLKTVPPFITHLTKLKCLELCGMPEEFSMAIKVFIEELRKHMKVKFKKMERSSSRGSPTAPNAGRRDPFGASSMHEIVPLKAQLRIVIFVAVALATAILDGQDDCLSTSPA